MIPAYLPSVCSWLPSPLPRTVDGMRRGIGFPPGNPVVVAAGLAGLATILRYG